MLDGLGLVYEKRGNTGAAAYNQPSNDNPFAVITEDLQGRVETIREGERKKADAVEKQNNLIIDTINPQGWDIDNRKMFFQKGLELKQEAATLAARGINLKDPTNPDALKFQQKQQDILNQASSSAAQKELFDPVYKEFIAKPDRYDKEKTIENIERFKALPFEERINVDPRTLLEKRFDKFASVAPVKNFNVFADKSPKRGTIIRPERIDAYLDTMVGDADVQESIEMGIQRGEWKDVQEWRDIQKKHIISRIPRDADKYYQPRSSSGGYGSDQQVDIVFNFDEKAILPNVKTNVKGVKTGTVPENSTLYSPTTLGTNKFTIAPGDVFETEVGKSKRTIPYILETGAIAVGLRHNNGMLMDEKSNVDVIKDGKTETISMQEAIKRGIVKYEPVIYGMAKTVGKNDVTGSDEKEEVSITVNASKLKSLKTGQEGKEDKNTILRIEAYQKAADELNQRAGYKTGSGAATPKVQTATPKAQTAAPKAKEAKMSFPEWKAKNPNGTPAQFKAYKNS